MYTFQNNANVNYIIPTKYTQCCTIVIKSDHHQIILQLVIIKLIITFDYNDFDYFHYTLTGDY